MPNPLATSTCLGGCDLSWTTGMPVHPEPAAGVRPRLPKKDLREMVVLVAVCVISTIVFVPPLAGVLQSAPEPSVLASRDLHSSGPLVHAPKPDAVRLVATSATDSPAVRVASVTRRETPRGGERRALAAKIGRALAGNGRHRAQPFPRPSE